MYLSVDLSIDLSGISRSIRSVPEIPGGVGEGVSRTPRCYITTSEEKRIWRPLRVPIGLLLPPHSRLASTGLKATLVASPTG